MSRNVIKGGDMMLFINNGTGDLKSIAFATSHTLTVSTDTQQTSTKDDGGKFQSSDYGIISWSASSENLCSYDGAGFNYQDLINLMLSQTKVTATFTIEGSSGSTYPYASKLDSVDDATGDVWAPGNKGTIGETSNKSLGYTGTVLITSVEVNAPNGENATMTVQLQGDGPLTATPTT
ncbi:MAG: phage tail protein [Muribaculaceae bacterium]|nr:phage tail protein [Muribaculaceae bacterium]